MRVVEEEYLSARGGGPVRRLSAGGGGLFNMIFSALSTAFAV